MPRFISLFLYLVGLGSAVAQQPRLTQNIDATEGGNAVLNQFDEMHRAVLGRTCFFVANDGRNGSELWRSDGTANGTTQVKDIQAGAGGSSPRNLIVANGSLYFTANDGISGDELWQSDGTAAGTRLVKDINPGPGDSQLRDMAVVANALFFIRYNGAVGDELWRSDGTSAGTVRLTTISPAGNGSYSHHLVATETMLFFTTTDEARGDELWGSDGTAAGTQLVSDLNPGPGGSYPHELLAAGGRLYFTANDGTTGDELWQSDGTAAGTRRIADINPGPGGSQPHNFVIANGLLYFITSDNTAGDELWRSDGTAAGTALVKQIDQEGNGSYAHHLTAVESSLFFVAADQARGDELWGSDGTAAGTQPVSDLNPGPGGSYPHELLAAGGRLYFTANDGTTGDELWQSDGTAAGTRRIADINPGPNGSYPFDLTNAAGTLYLTANDGAHGQELWVLTGSGITKVDLALSMIASRRVAAVNEPVTYTVRLQNQSQDPGTPLATASWQNRLPDNLTFVGGDNVRYENGGVSGQVTDLAAGQMATFSYQLKPTAPGTYLNAAQISTGTYPDPDSKPDSGTGDGEDDAAQVDIRTLNAASQVYRSPNPTQAALPAVQRNAPPTDPNKADLSLELVASQLVARPQDVLSLTLIVTNDGGRPATNVRLAYQLPAGIEFVDGNGWVVSGTRLLNTLGSLGSGQRLAVPVQVRVLGSGWLLQQAEILASDVPDPDSTPGNGFTNGEDDVALARIRVL